MARARKVNVASVFLWGREAGAIAWDEDRETGSFQYADGFARRGLEPAPLTMPLDSRRIYSFPALNRDTFRGLPGLLADSLPDRYGNALIDVWLGRQGRDPKDFSPVERLCYLGRRGMGALEFKPSIGERHRKTIPLEVSELTQLAAEVVKHRARLAVNLGKEKEEALNTIIRVGTSAGGARAKAVIAWNPKTREVRSGQLPPPVGFEPWILKFDGVSESMLGEPAGFGRVEFAYHRMATAAGIEMSPCRLLEEGPRAHFMTRRFDRTPSGEKLHMQSLCAMRHYDFNAPGEYSYEQAIGVAQELRLPHPAVRSLFRRMVFNVVARNQDDHTRNISFLMDKEGTWSLAPAYDVMWSYNPRGQWTNRHQMSVNGKRDDFTKDDLLSVASQYGIGNAREILDEVHDAVSRWPEFAAESQAGADMIKEIARTHRLHVAA